MKKEIEALRERGMEEGVDRHKMNKLLSKIGNLFRDEVEEKEERKSRPIFPWGKVVAQLSERIIFENTEDHKRRDVLKKWQVIGGEFANTSGGHFAKVIFSREDHEEYAELKGQHDENEALRQSLAKRLLNTHGIPAETWICFRDDGHTAKLIYLWEKSGMIYYRNRSVRSPASWSDEHRTRGVVNSGLPSYLGKEY